jgi:hypothetical protein
METPNKLNKKIKLIEDEGETFNNSQPNIK